MVSKFKEANQLLRSGKLEEAVATYRAAIEENAGFYGTYQNLGETLWKLGRLDEAIAAFRQVVELNPRAVWGLYQLGELLRQQKQFEEAVIYLRRAVEIKSDVGEFYLSLGAALVELGSLDEAVEYLRRAVELNPLAEAYYYLGVAQSQQQHWSEAVEYYRQGLEINPGDVEGYLGLAKALSQLGKWSEAVECYRQVLTLSESGEVLFRLGQALGQLEQWEDAIAEYQRAINLGFAGAEVRHHLGYALSQLGRYEEAVVELRQVVEENPRSAQVRHQLGYALSQLQRWREAEIELRKVAELHPRSPVVWQQLGDVLQELGEKDEAVEAYRKALETQPNLVRQRLVTEPDDKIFSSPLPPGKLSDRSEISENRKVKQEQSVIVSLYEERLLKSAQSYLVKEEYDQVIDKCSSIIAANPILTDVFPILGAAYSEKNQQQKAELFLKNTQHLRHLIATQTIEKVWGTVIQKSSQVGNDEIIERQRQRSISTIVIYTCVWRRPELTRIVLSYYSHLQKELAGQIKLELLAVGSEGETSRQLCEECGFDYFEYANQPLSAKWEYGINRCADYDPDGVIIVGSDDLISRNLIEFYDSQLKNNLIFCGLKDGYFFDVNNEHLILWTGYNARADPTRLGETIGMGRCLSKVLLDRLGFSIWKGLALNRGLDGAMTQKLLQLGLQILDYGNCVIASVGDQEYRIGHCGFKMAELGVCAVDLKFAENLTTFERYGIRSRVTSQNDPWKILSRYFSDTTTMALRSLVN